MYKTFIIAAAAAFISFSERTVTDPAVTGNPLETFTLFPFKNTMPNPLEAPVTTKQSWGEHWLGEAQELIRKSEYHFVYENEYKAYCTSNRKNNLRFFYDEAGFSVEPRMTRITLGDQDAKTDPADRRYRSIPNWKIKFDLDKKQIGEGLWKITENKAAYVTDNITVQYINDEQGMRQNFIVHSPVTNDDELKINFSVKTKLKTYLHGNQLQFFHKKNNVLNYDQLKVWDANGKPLQAGLRKKANGKYTIAVDAKYASYPITIDPLSSTPNSTPDDGNQAGAQFGYSVASAGDVNGDGYSDVIISAIYYDDGANTAEGRVFAYHGSATGLSAAPASIMDDGNQENLAFGYSISTAGDVNGDGYSDIIIGTPYYDDGANTDEGRAFVYHGSASGLSAAPSNTPNDGNAASLSFGYSVACAGDVNGDGYSDIIIGAPRYNDGANNTEGRAFVYHGSATGLSASPDNTPDDANLGGAWFGSAVAGAGDVNGDGYSDVIIGAPRYLDAGNNTEGRAFVYHGSASGLAASPASTPDDANEVNAWFGISVASAGDVNGDGYSDVIIGADQCINGDGTDGAMFVYHGSATGIGASFASRRHEASQPNTWYGRSVACAGDVNGDGYSDVIVGAWQYNDGSNTGEGAAYVYHGSATGISAGVTTLLTNANQAYAHFGFSVASAGDINGDGYSDVIVGANIYDDGANADEGRAFVYHGSPAGLSTSPNNTQDDGNQAGANFGFSVATAGDVNADGYSDVIIGAFMYDDGANTDEGRSFVYHGSATGLAASPNNTQDDADQLGANFGISVSSAGDVNGDGYSDVIIGAHVYDDGANTNEGRAYIYHGSATGLGSSPASTLDDADQANTLFGVSVADAGDVNGDGYSDVIIGAYQYDDGANTNEGRVFIYHGSPTGIGASPASMPDDANQAGASFGFSVAGAGDVNGDGYSDVVIGAYQYDDGANTDEGRAYVYHGSASGISASPASTPDDADQAGACLGVAVSSAGDVNGDGYSDVIIGAYLYDDGANIDEGRAYVYHGSATGLAATPSNTQNDSNQGYANFGISVSGAGDVNGDGYSDVIIGAAQYDDGANINEGRAYIYHGSSTGLAASPSSTIDDANQGSTLMANSVSAAGDVNGDGYSDVIVGANGYDDGANTDEGRSFVYNGNELTANKRNNLRLYNANLTTPINNNSYLVANFGAGLFARSFLGRNRGKLVWETRLSYTPYSGTPITNSVFFTSQQATYTSLGTTGTELKNVINKITGAGKHTRIRARIKYAPYLAITGQVYGPWRYVSSIIDANNLGVLPLELTTFKAAWIEKGKTAKLDFTTDKENGICCFDIEKSNDGLNYLVIGTVPARNTATPQSYSFTDVNAGSRIQYYRLKIKAHTGAFDYSNIQQLQYAGAKELLVFPNPTTDVLQVLLNGNHGKLMVQIFSSNGKLVKQLQVNNPGQTLVIPVKEMAAGTYWLKLQNGNTQQQLQFIKQ